MRRRCLGTPRQRAALSPELALLLLELLTAGGESRFTTRQVALVAVEDARALVELDGSPVEVAFRHACGEGFGIQFVRAALEDRLAFSEPCFAAGERRLSVVERCRPARELAL